MRTQLQQVKVPDDQIEGLLVVYRSAVAYDYFERYAWINAFLSFASFCVGLLGLCLTLWNRQRRLAALFVKSGGLAKAAQKALADHRAGNSSDVPDDAE